MILSFLFAGQVRGFKDADKLESGLLTVGTASGTTAGATAFQLRSAKTAVRSALNLSAASGTGDR